LTEKELQDPANDIVCKRRVGFRQSATGAVFKGEQPPAQTKSVYAVTFAQTTDVVRRNGMQAQRRKSCTIL
jgi:hypothetical protein